MTQVLGLANKTIPKPMSALTVELYEEQPPSAQQVYNRAKYFVVAYLDGQPVQVPNVTCNPLFQCSWEELSLRLAAQRFQDVITGQNIEDLHTLC